MMGAFDSIYLPHYGLHGNSKSDIEPAPALGFYVSYFNGYTGCTGKWFDTIGEAEQFYEQCAADGKEGITRWYSLEKP